MKKQLLLATMLAIGFASCNIQNANAASQFVTATLATSQSITVKGGQTVSTTINNTDGSLAAALTPGFTVFSNTAATLWMSATVATSTGTNENAFGNQSGVYYLALGNNTNGDKPTIAAIQNALGPTPVVASNYEVIAYALTGVPSSATGMSTFVWDTTGTGSVPQFKSTISNSTNGNTILTTGTAARSGTFDVAYEDAGDYQATISLSFTSL